MPSLIKTALVSLTTLLALSDAEPISIRHRRQQAAPAQCRALPGDSDWPSDDLWSTLNHDVGGRLIKTVPLGAPCHAPNYDAEKCQKLADGWILPETHFPDPSSFLGPYFQNTSCDPFTDPDTPCEIGNYPEYAIQVEQTSDLIAGVKFARENNIRLIIKNTGHCMLGRSSGLGSLSLWTHHLQDIEIQDFTGPTYTGKAIKLGAGIQAYQAYQAAADAGYRVVGGTCATVGLTGGFTQGGGLSMMSTQYGLGADQVLEWEVVTANGEHVVATPDQHQDLYWALSGGGPGIYGAVVSMTVKLYKDAPVVGASLRINQNGEAKDTFWESIQEYNSEQPAWVDAGGATTFYITPGEFYMRAAVFPTSTEEEVKAITKGLTDKLDALDVTYTFNITSFDSYLDFFVEYFGPLPYGPLTAAEAIGGRLIPRDVVTNPDRLSNLTTAMRNIIDTPGFRFIGISAHPKGPSSEHNSVLPQWRTTLLTGMWTAPWDFEKGYDANFANQKLITEHLDPGVKAVTGSDSGVYMNEGDHEQEDWKEQFFGVNYDRLKEIKTKYDPQGVFYGMTLVGAEDWTVASDGRLCKA